jgi:opacity protein-like surface antigen
MYMKKFVNVVAVAVLVLSAAATSAQPQSGDVGVFADQAGTLSTFSLVPFNSTQRVHVVGFDLGDLKSFEFGVNGFDGWFVFGTQINGNLNLGGAFSDVGFADFIVGTGGCIDGSGAIWLATITFGDFTGLPVVDRPLCMRASSSTATFQGVPGYFRCDGSVPQDQQAVEFGVAQNGGEFYPDGCLIVNPSQVEGPVSLDAASFGEMKARF